MFITSGKTRARTVPGPSFFSREEAKSVSTGLWVDSLASTSYTGGGTQITESDGNPWPPPKGGPLQDRGSEFFSQKTEVVNSKFPYSVNYYHDPFNDRKYRASGNNWLANAWETVPWADPAGYDGFLKRPLKLNFPPDLSSSRSALDVKGAIAVAAVSPTNQIAHTASAVTELLRDMPRIPGIALWESRLRAIATLAATGEEFLNYIFGIAPTLGDMGTFLKAVHKIDHVIDQFERDAGNVVRRKFVFPKERTETTTVLDGTYSPVGSIRSHGGIPPEANTGRNELLPGWGQSHPVFETIRTRVTEREIWFSGAFTYHLPGGYDTHAVGDRRALMAKLFGAEPDLNTVWQLAPWSWAVDWFSDAGAFVKNLQSKISYGTVLRYGYVMEKTTTTDTYTAGKVVSVPLRPVNPANLPDPYPAISPVTLRRTTKKRIKANPFGFGVSWDGLSTVQQAIVAALGITRAVR